MKGTASDMTSPTASPSSDSAFVDLAEGGAPATPVQTAEAALTALYPLDPEWKYERLDFHGDKLAVRTPNDQALAGFSLSSSKYIPVDVKNDMTGLFLSEHLGPDTYNHVMVRLFKAGDPDYDTRTLGVLLQELVLLNAGAKKARAEKAGQDG